MARGRKSHSLEEQLETVNENITITENSLKTLKGQKKELEEKIKQQRLDELYNIIQESGKTIDEVKNLVFTAIQA